MSGNFTNYLLYRWTITKEIMVGEVSWGASRKDISLQQQDSAPRPQRTSIYLPAKGSNFKFKDFSYYQVTDIRNHYDISEQAEGPYYERR